MRVLRAVVGLTIVVASASLSGRQQSPAIGSEKAVPLHLSGGKEIQIPPRELIDFGARLFSANWTEEDGAGRPLSTGTGKRLTDPTQRLDRLRTFNRVSGPDANSCAGCHNLPRTGGGGDFVTNVFQMAQRFDFVTFDRKDLTPTRGSLDERGKPATLQTVGNSRSTPGLFGAGYLEMLAREMTADLQRVRDSLGPGQSRPLVTKGVSFGVLARRQDGTWDVRRVEGLPAQSLVASKLLGPSLVVRPWQQSGTTASLREIINTSLNQHHGIQSTERFGMNTDPDRDGVRNEVTRGDVTAATIFIAALPVPGRVIPKDPEVERAVVTGERLFSDIRCTACHLPTLPLTAAGRMYSEPGPHNAAGNLQRSAATLLRVDLTDPVLPPPRLSRSVRNQEVIDVPAFTDLKLHDITDPADNAAKEPLDINEPAGSAKFFAGNRRFLTKRLWGAASEPPYFHHGLFTSLPEAILAHAAEAIEQRRAFERLSRQDQDAIVKFLESLQVLPPGTKHLVVDEDYRPRIWPPKEAEASRAR